MQLLPYDGVLGIGHTFFGKVNFQEMINVCIHGDNIIVEDIFVEDLIYRLKTIATPLESNFETKIRLICFGSPTAM